ncbi:hypothetical protein ACROYT_G015737 [Oculina patagonica]
MFTAPLWCLLFGTAICLAVQDDFSDAKQKEMNEALGKAILKMLGLKHSPKVKKEINEKVPQYLLDEYNNQFDEPEKEEDLSVRTTENYDCSRQNFVVNFTEIYGRGNFVVTPKVYNAFSCKGRCPFPLYQGLNATNHAVIQTIANLKNSRSVHPACCVPITLKPLNIMYKDNNGRLRGKGMKDMIVDKCGCR